MTEILRDSINPNNIPADTPIVGGYVDGLYGLGTQYWNAVAWAHWAATGATLRRIAAVTVNTPSNTADVERYDLSPAQAPIWWHNMHGRGETDLWVYVNLSNRIATEDALWAAGVPTDLCSMWIATLNGVVEQLTAYRYPIAAQQWVDRGPYDESVVYQNFGGGGGSELGGDMRPQLANILSRLCRIHATGHEPDPATLAADIASCAPSDDAALAHLVQVLAQGSGKPGEGTTYIERTAQVVAAGPAGAVPAGTKVSGTFTGETAPS